MFEAPWAAQPLGFRSPSDWRPFSPIFCGGGFPYSNRLQGKEKKTKGTLILTSLLEDLVGFLAMFRVWCLDFPLNSHKFFSPLAGGSDNGRPCLSVEVKAPPVKLDPAKFRSVFKKGGRWIFIVKTEASDGKGEASRM